MKKAALIIFGLAISAGAAHAQYFGSNNNNNSGYGSQNYGSGSNPSGHYVAPHTNSNGSFTGGHYQSNSNNTQMDNYSSRGNVNPYTGNVGTRTPRY